MGVNTISLVFELDLPNALLSYRYISCFNITSVNYDIYIRYISMRCKEISYYSCHYIFYYI